jgi:hypothetical protein
LCGRGRRRAAATAATGHERETRRQRQQAASRFEGGRFGAHRGDILSKSILWIGARRHGGWPAIGFDQRIATCVPNVA